MTKPQVLPLPTGDWVVASSTHATKGAADKAANKIARTQIDVQSEASDMVAFIHKRHPCDLEDPAPDQLQISFNGNICMISFYVNKEGRYVARSSGGIFGEGANWWMAANDCMTKILEKK